MCFIFPKFSNILILILFTQVPPYRVAWCCRHNTIQPSVQTHDCLNRSTYSHQILITIMCIIAGHWSQNAQLLPRLAWTKEVKTELQSRRYHDDRYIINNRRPRRSGELFLLVNCLRCFAFVQVYFAKLSLHPYKSAPSSLSSFGQSVGRSVILYWHQTSSYHLSTIGIGRN